MGLGCGMRYRDVGCDIGPPHARGPSPVTRCRSTFASVEAYSRKRAHSAPVLEIFSLPAVCGVLGVCVRSCRVYPDQGLSRSRSCPSVIIRGEPIRSDVPIRGEPWRRAVAARVGVVIKARGDSGFAKCFDFRYRPAPHSASDCRTPCDLRLFGCIPSGSRVRFPDCRMPGPGHVVALAWGRPRAERVVLVCLRDRIYCRYR